MRVGTRRGSEAFSALAFPVGPTMRRLGSVQRKMPCLFVTEVKEEPSSKREQQVPRVGGLGRPHVPPPAAPLRLNPPRAPGCDGAALRPGSFLQVWLGEV